MPPRRPIAPIATAALALCLAAAPGPAAGQGAAEVVRPAEPAELLVEIVDERGRPVAEGAQALELSVNGTRRALRDLGPVTEPWQVVVYFDLLLGDPVRQRAAAFELAQRAARLTALGPVEIVLAGETLRTSLPPTAEPAALAEALSWIRLRETGSAAQRSVRERFVEEHALDGGEPPEAEDRVTRIARLGEGVRRAAADEAAVLAAQRRLLLELLAREAPPGPKLLLLVTGGFDPDPMVFYRAALGGTDLAAAVSGAVAPAVEPSLDELGRALSLYGWLVAPVRPGAAVDPLSQETEEEIAARRDEQVQTQSQAGSLDTPRTVGVISASKLLRRKRRDGEEEGGVAARLVDPEAPLRQLARVTGGDLIADADGLDGFLGRLPERRRIAFDGGLADATSPARIQLRPAPGSGDLGVRARQWVGAATPAALASLRARRFLDSELGEGELPVDAVLQAGVEGQPAKLVVRLAPEARSDVQTPLRVSVAAEGADGSIEVRHFRVGGPGGQDATVGPDGSRLVDLPVFFPPAATAAAVVEDLASGRWGGAFAEESLEGVVPTADDSLFLPAPKAVHLMAPREAMVMGRTTFETVVSQHQVERVEFFLDGERVSVASAPPFSATVDLGRLPESHEVEAVAYGPDGEELDRDRLIVNEGTGSFRIRIEDPRSRAQRRGVELLVGTFEVEVDVKLPRGAELDRLEIYWRNRLVGTRYAPPWVHRLRIDPADPKGFVRAVAVLEDGAVAEDVLFINSPGSTERVDVDLVELYVVVTDRKGRPIRDLDQSRFTVLEEGRRQPLATFGDAGDLPITVGLVIDSSASMFVKLPEVQAAAARYIQGLTTRRDRAFVVGFGSEPRLARDTTTDMLAAVEGLYRLEPDGQTAVWKAIVYSLVQLQGVVGKKALIVYSDGADEDPDFSFKTALRFAQRVGVPVYFIIANDEIYRTGGKSLNIRSFLGRLEHLTRQVGGRVFLTPVDQDLGEIYEEIDLELRSQYLLGYYPTEAEADGWRKVEVRVDESGARPRTISGYYR